MIREATQSVPPIAVLTGDLVGSTVLGRRDVDAAFETLGQAADVIAGWSDLAPRLSRNRGDGWQAVVPASLCLRAALTFRAALIAEQDAWDSRIAVAAGEAPAPLPDDLNTATGPVFTASGHALDAMKPPARMAGPGGPGGAAFLLADHIVQGWTQAQAAAMLPMLAPKAPTRAAVGRSLGITRQAVDQAVNAAGLPAIAAALKEFEGHRP
jgi:hypothetical protein